MSTTNILDLNNCISALDTTVAGLTDSMDSMRFYTLDIPGTEINISWAGAMYYANILLTAPENLTGKKLFMSFEPTTTYIPLGWSAAVQSDGTKINFSMNRPDNTARVAGKLHIMVKD